MTNEKLQEEIVELQTRLLFQEDVIQKLDEVVVAQAEAISKLTLRLAEVERQIDGMRFDQEQNQLPENERPPHY